MRSMTVLFNAQVNESSMGGGDKIVLSVCNELSKDTPDSIAFLGCPEGEKMLRNSGSVLPFIKLNTIKVTNNNFIFAYFLRMLISPLILLKDISPSGILWSSSDFLPDTLPAFIFKIAHPKSAWFSSFFLSARNPFTHEIDLNFKTLFYFLSQRVAILMFRLTCDVVFVLSDLDRKFLVNHGIAANKIHLLSGGVDLKLFDSVPEPQKIYDACFIGRFHYQKGLPDLFYAWSKVIAQKPNAKFAMIGWGDDSQVAVVKNLISKYSMQNNVDLLGFLDGVGKIKVLKSSKVLCFPSTFESWGVVVAEGIAAKIPVVAYDLPVLRDKFKQGVSFVPLLNIDLYAEEVSKLVFDDALGKIIIEKAALFRNELSWDTSVKVLRDLSI